MSGKTQIWTPQNIERVIGIFAGHDSFDAALAAISRALGVALSRQAVDQALIRAGKPSGFQLLRPQQARARSYIREISTHVPQPDVDIPVTVDQTWDDETDPHLEIPTGELPLLDPTPDRTYIDRGSELPPYAAHEYAPAEEPEALLAIPDCHHPYVDKKAWALVVRVGHVMRARFKRLRIIVMGDFADFYAVSAHDKDPSRGSRLADEIGVTNEALDELDAIGADAKHFIEGNHETRLARKLARDAPALVGMGGLTVPAQFKLAVRGWTWCPYRSYIKLGSLIATHDVEHAGAYALHRTLAACGHTVIIGHTHRLGLHSDRSMFGEPHFAASFGWLGNVDSVDYRHRVKAMREWQLGIGLGLMEPDGTVHMHPAPIVGGGTRVAVMGEVISLT